MAAKKLLSEDSMFDSSYLIRRAVENLSQALKSSTLSDSILTDALQDLVIAKIKHNGTV